MGSKGRAAVSLTIWAALLFSVLQIGQVSALDSHGHGGLSICGPWGCGPPVRALIGWHGFWLVFLALPGVLLVRSSSATRLLWLGLIVSIAGVLSLVAICVYEAVHWLPRVPEGTPTYFVQRCLFRIATWTDPPLAALTVLGLVMFFAALVKEERRHCASINAESGP